MGDIKTYPEMNKTIKDLLRVSDEPMNQYILARIEELEKQVEDLVPPPNVPLTLEELREMDGEPVWVFPADGFDLIPANYLVNVSNEILVDNFGSYLDFDEYGKEWLACRRKPEEVTT